MISVILLSSRAGLVSHSLVSQTSEFKALVNSPKQIPFSINNLNNFHSLDGTKKCGSIDLSVGSVSEGQKTIWTQCFSLIVRFIHVRIHLNVA